MQGEGVLLLVDCFWQLLRKTCQSYKNISKEMVKNNSWLIIELPLLLVASHKTGCF